MVCAGLGPGSYTGIRAAISIVQGWQLARGTKSAGISSVEAIAAQAQSENIFGAVNVVINAQRNEFYLATFEISASGWCESEPLKIVARAEVESRAGRDKIIVGPGAAEWFSGERNIFPRAGCLAQLAARHATDVAGEKLEPIYLRETAFVKASSQV